MSPSPTPDEVRAGGDPRRLFRTSLTLTAAERLAKRERPHEANPRRDDDPPPHARRAADFLRTKGELQERLLEEIGEHAGVQTKREEVEEFVRDFVDRVLERETLTLNDEERARLASELVEEAVGLGPLAPLMADPAVTDILVNGPYSIYVERFGRLEKTGVQFRDDEHVIRVIERIAASVGRRIDQASPMVDTRLQDGSRVNATIPPATIDYPTLSIRRFGRRRLRRVDLRQLGMFSDEVMTFLDFAVRGRANILISGGTGAGKSTLLGALAEAIPRDERIVTIEDTAELILDQDHIVRMETRPANIEGRGSITARDLLINALRMRPTRIIVGEVRGGEALELLQALNTGHDGGMSTIHANSTRDALHRLETLVLMSGLDLPARAIREQVVSAIDLLVQVDRFEDGVRRIVSVSEISGMEGSTPRLNDIFRFERRGRKDRRVIGEFVPTGAIPKMVEELRARGEEVPLSIFNKEAIGRRG